MRLFNKLIGAKYAESTGKGTPEEINCKLSYIFKGIFL